jgi:ComF family protein
MRPIAAILRTLDLFFPSVCLACEVRVPPEVPWCEACAVALVSGLDAACPRCGVVWLEPPPGGARHVCGACIKDSPPFRSAAGVFAYGGPIQDAIARWKNRPEEWLGRPLSRLFAEAVAPATVSADTVIVPIPSAPQRLSRRGFNPPTMLSRALSARTGVRVRARALDMVRAPLTSRRLSRQERLSRMEGVFVARRGLVSQRHVLLIDDVMTTGATLRAAATACLDAGARSVDARVLARVPAR